MKNIQLIRRYANNILIDLTKISYFKLDNNSIYFYNNTPNYGGSFFLSFGFSMTSSKNLLEVIKWDTTEDALNEFNDIQKDLNVYYQNVGTVKKFD